jgi:hypothetical protein
MELEANAVFENTHFARGWGAQEKNGRTFGVSLEDFVEDGLRAEAARPIFDLTALGKRERFVRLREQAIAQLIQIQPWTIIRRAMNHPESVGGSRFDNRPAQSQPGLSCEIRRSRKGNGLAGRWVFDLEVRGVQAKA